VELPQRFIGLLIKRAHGGRVLSTRGTLEIQALHGNALTLMLIGASIVLSLNLDPAEIRAFLKCIFTILKSTAR
jgi:hypothetical protein